MKKLVLGAVALFMFTSATFATEVKAELKSESKFDTVGSCHITITNTRTGEVVYEITLPANSAEACEKMGEATLQAVIDGRL